MTIYAYAKCCESFMLSVTNNTIIMNVVMLSVVMLNVVAPLIQPFCGSSLSVTNLY
jgi:hypothetical protein